MSENIWTLAELKNDGIRKVSREVLSEGVRMAERLGCRFAAVLIGDVPEAAAKEAAAYAAEVYVISGKCVASYTPEGYAAALADLAREKRPRLILAGATARASDFLPRAAAMLGAAYAPGCVAVETDGNNISVRKPMYGGKVSAAFSFSGEPVIITVRPNMLAEASPSASSEIVQIDAAVPEGGLKTAMMEERPLATAKVDLAEAEIVVSGGRGMRAPENFGLIEELADALGAAVGASRAVVDAGWRDYAEQVGKSGKTVAPKLYFACGISGAIHHILGMDSSKVVVAVNKDPKAPIFGYADYGVVGDCMEVLPSLTKAFKELLAEV